MNVYSIGYRVGCALRDPLAAFTRLTEPAAQGVVRLIAPLAKAIAPPLAATGAALKAVGRFAREALIWAIVIAIAVGFYYAVAVCIGAALLFVLEVAR